MAPTPKERKAVHPTRQASLDLPYSPCMEGQFHSRQEVLEVIVSSDMQKQQEVELNLFY